MDAIKDAIQELYRAMLAHDLVALDRLLTEDTVYIHSTGVAETKAQYLNGVRDRAYEYHRLRPVTEQIRQSGELATVYAELDFMGGARGERHPPIRLLTTLVWVRADGAWRMAIRQATRIP
jgi:uncharacterized protein (TIGR02246 family)